jgi:hypothetical protein
MTENITETVQPEVVKKKRGRKKKSELENTEETLVKETEPHVPKKRGRKPKGGKLVMKPIEPQEDVSKSSNIILHLKCSMQDIELQDEKVNTLMKDPLSYKPIAPPNIMTYNQETQNLKYDIISEKETKSFAYNDVNENNSVVCSKCQTKIEAIDEESNKDNSVNMKDLNSKLKDLKLQLYKDSSPDKKSACFWCTYDFDNPPCFIPKYELDGNIIGYGSFCRPECSVAYLMKENIDDSAKFERYQLLNKIYGKVYNYKKNITPSPNPYYTLDKFYGNLSIQEYRKLLNSEHMLLVLEKPLTRILPELHEDTEDVNGDKFNNKLGVGNKTSGYKVKRQSEKLQGPSKNDIIRESFGF